MKARSIGVAIAAALFALTAMAPGARAETTVSAERYGGEATGRALGLTLHGQSVTFGAGAAGSDLDPVRDSVTAAATGIGSQMVEQTIVAAGIGESNEQCAPSGLTDVLGDIDLGIDLVCGKAEVTGSGTDIVARGSGRIARLDLSSEGLLRSLFDGTALAPIVDETLGHVRDVAASAEEAADENVDPLVKEAVDTLNQNLSALTGSDVLPALDISDTVGDLVDRITAGSLVDVRLGEARGTVSSGADQLTAKAEDEGAVVTVLPGFWVDGSALATVTVGASAAEVVYDRRSTETSGASSATTVRVESPLLPEPVVVAEGQRHSVFCDGAGVAGLDLPIDTGLLCTEIAVSSPSEQTVDGRLRTEASLVTIHVAKGLDQLLDPAALALPALPDLGSVLPVALPLGGGVATASSGGEAGVKLELAGARAEAGGAKVLSETTVEDPAPFEGSLPRTGLGSALPAAATGLVGAAFGARALVRRFRS